MNSGIPGPDEWAVLRRRIIELAREGDLPEQDEDLHSFSSASHALLIVAGLRRDGILYVKGRKGNRKYAVDEDALEEVEKRERQLLKRYLAQYGDPNEWPADSD